jgi:glycerol-3-phosphate O-acyltransferase
MPRRAILIVASASALLAPQTRVTHTPLHSTTLNPLEQLAEQAQIKAYEASAAAIAATISAKVAEKGDRMPDGMVPIVQEFMRTYLDVVAKQKRDPMEKVPVLKEYLGLVEDQLDEPFVFAPFHEAWTEENGAPIDHLAMDTAFMEPMLDPNDSVLLGSERVKDIEALLAKGDNVVLLSNHQTEADPSCWSFALHENHERLERDMIMVAGDRVTTDVVAVPFSKARNLLCIYSKRHIDNPPEEKPKKMRHNAKTMTAMLRLFKGGGKCIWVAPSGGRDRPNSDGVYTPAQFDPKSVEMFRLMSAKAADKTTHFYPVAMMTHRLFPPPKTLTPGALGEPRRAIRGSVNIAIGEPIDFDEVTRAGCLVDDFPPGCVEDREDAAQVAAEYAHLQVSQLYADLVKDAKDRGSPYYSADRY